MHNDDDLRARYRKLADHDESSAPNLSANEINAWRSSVIERSHRTWRLGTVVGVAAGAVIMLTLGLVLGASTGYASAEEIVKERGGTPLPPAAGLAALKVIPPLIFSCGSPVRAATLPPVPQGVPIVELPAATTKTAATLASVLGLRQLSNGNLLVNDAGRRQVHLFDSSLTLLSTVRDSVPGTSTSYGPRPVPLMRYLGDSSLLADNSAGSLLVMGPTGEIARAMAPSHPGMMLGLNLDFGAVDERGRIIFSTGIRYPKGLSYAPESTVVLRADLDARSVDTVGRMKTWPSTTMIRNGGVTKFTADPLPLIDEWAMLSDGSLAIVRGQDYHIDWMQPDGTKHSTQKLPFDWKRLTDSLKQHLIDSVRETDSPQMALNLGRRRADAGTGDGRGGRGYAPPGSIIQGPPVPVEYVPPSLSEMFDYYPPIRHHALMPDLDGNLWILPTSSAQSKNGELVYDVANVKGEFRRVRVPLGRSIIGFGKGGVVFLLSGDKTNGFYLERTKLPQLPKSTPR